MLDKANIKVLLKDNYIQMYGCEENILEKSEGVEEPNCIQGDRILLKGNKRAKQGSL